MRYTDRDVPVDSDCPKCEGVGGEAVVYGGRFGSGGTAEWVRCEVCSGDGSLSRIDRLAWLIGEERRMDAQLAFHAAMLADQKANAAWNAARAAVRMAVMAAV